MFHQNTCVNFVNSSLDNCNYNEKSESLIKKLHIWNTVRLSLRGKKIIINIYYSKIYQKGNWKEKIQFPPEQWKKSDFPDT